MHLENICVAVLTALAATGASAQATPGNWDAAYTKARAALAKLSLADKVGIVTGVGWNQGACVGNVHAASAIGFPSLCLQDGPLGVRYAKSITAFTPGVQAASTWDVELMHQRGEFLGVEAKQLGIQVMLGPSAGPLGKNPEGGRNWEGFSPDPYLSGEGMRATVEGMQSAGVQATAKHWILNEQELNRNTMSSDADDRTVHELYTWPFMDAVKADAAAFMCSYNRVNSTYACENSYVMQELLKDQLGFKGYIMSDWGAHMTTVAGANTGLDMSMPGSNFNGGDIRWGSNLTAAINAGTVALSRVEDMVVRILAPWYLLGQDQGYPSVDLTREVQGDHKTNVRAVARDGTVLLKNDNAMLPLKATASKIAVVGTGAYKGDHANNAATCQDKACNLGALGMGWGSGAVDYPYFVAPYDAIAEKVSSTGGSVVQSNSDNASQGATAAQGADLALVFITADGGEGYLTVEGVAGDRNDLDPWHNGNALVKAVADANSNVIVVVHSIGPIILESVLSNPSVKAIVWAGLPSQESGNALVDVLWGDVNPSGKLVYTIGKQQADYGTKVTQGTDTHKEGLFIDYRHFDHSNIAPRYEFGFGLSYTNFTYADLAVSAASATSGPTTGTIVPGGPQDLWDTVATVTAEITNSGDVQGAEVAQLYITLPASAPSTPPRQLRGFAKLPLAPGASGTATFALTRRDLSYWDVASKKWVLPAGEFGISVGASSRDLRLQGSLVVA